MVAYILQMLFAALTLFSILIMLIMSIKNMRATKKQWWLLLLPIMFLFMTIAYRFDWIANSNNDLSRFFQDFEGVKYYGFDYEMRHADKFSWLWRVVVYVCCNMENLHWFPALATAVVYLIFFYILVEMAERHSFSAIDVLICLILQMSFLPLIMTATACRNTMAYALFAMGVFAYYRKGLGDIRIYLWFIAGVLMHTTVIIGVAVFFLSLLTKRNRYAVWLFLPLGIFLGNVILPMLASSTNEYVQYLTGRWDQYLENPNQFDIVKSWMMMVALAPMLVCLLAWFSGKNQSPQKEKVAYIIVNMAVTAGTFDLMAELFLRLTYSTALLLPLIWGEMKSTTWRNPKNAQIFWLILICLAGLAFVATRGAWMWQINWFFEM